MLPLHSAKHHIVTAANEQLMFFHGHKMAIKHIQPSMIGTKLEPYCSLNVNCVVVLTWLPADRSVVDKNSVSSVVSVTLATMNYRLLSCS